MPEIIKGLNSVVAYYLALKSDGLLISPSKSSAIKCRDIIKE
jgi:hypothetical protein